jgi:hypothetical protein
VHEPHERSGSAPATVGGGASVGAGTVNGKGKVIHCAIYARKSTEEGLEQTFNSLDAQREACVAYIASQ